MIYAHYALSFIIAILGLLYGISFIPEWNTLHKHDKSAIGFIMTICAADIVVMVAVWAM